MDFRPSFTRPCSEEDYSSWDLTNLQVGQAAGPPAPSEPLLLPEVFPELRPSIDIWTSGFSSPFLVLGCSGLSHSGGTGSQAPTQLWSQVCLRSDRRMVTQHVYPV